MPSFRTNDIILFILHHVVSRIPRSNICVSIYPITGYNILATENSINKNPCSSVKSKNFKLTSPIISYLDEIFRDPLLPLKFPLLSTVPLGFLQMGLRLCGSDLIVPIDRLRNVVPQLRALPWSLMLQRYGVLLQSLFTHFWSRIEEYGFLLQD